MLPKPFVDDTGFGSGATSSTNEHHQYERPTGGLRSAAARAADELPRPGFSVIINGIRF